MENNKKKRIFNAVLGLMFVSGISVMLAQFWPGGVVQNILNGIGIIGGFACIIVSIVMIIRNIRNHG